MQIRRSKVCAVFLGAALMAAAARGAEPSSTAEALELYKELQNVRIDPSQVYAVRDIHLSRGGLNIYLNRGFIGLLAPVGGKVTGAAFSGDGEILLLPPNQVEKRSLAQFTKSAVLEDRFTSAHFRFSDDSAQDLMAGARKPEPDDPDQPAGLVDKWSEVTLGLNRQFAGRILEDIIGDKDRPLFFASIEGKQLGTFTVTDDERAPEAIRVGSIREKAGRIFADVWCAFPSNKSANRKEELAEGSARVLSYKIDTRILDDNSLEGHAELELESLSNHDRILSFELARTLHAQSITDETGAEVPILSLSYTDSPEVERVIDWVTVVLDSPRPAGTKFRLTFTYQGNVISDVGNGVLYVGARSSWYPNRGPRGHATYDLTFTYPERLTLVATGKLMDSGTKEGLKHSRWVSDGPFHVAGFNLGLYHSRTRKVGDVTVEVYATQDIEAALERRYVQAAGQLVIERGPEGRGTLHVLPAPPPTIPDPASLLDQVLSRAAGAIRYFQEIFGPFPYPRLALAQIPGNFGQGWPELVYLPTLTFLSDSAQSEISRRASAHHFDPAIFITHEIAHQWWGNEVGWDSYHDQWLSEGFATYAAALAMSKEKDGERKFRDVLRAYKQELLSKNEDGKTIESGGPIWLGHRLSSSLNPQGYDDIVYKKSCWVLHMLRHLMADPKTGSDDRFFAMLREFIEQYRGENPSTEDFLRHANRYMTPAMDLDHNHRLDWFFADWVYGTGIPEYKIQTRIRELAGNRYLIQGTIKQSGVPDHFEMLVPVISETGRGGKLLLGRVAVTGPEISFRFRTTHKPARVTIDDTNLLAIVR